MQEILDILTSPYATGILQAASLVLARLLPVITFTPVLGGPMLPKRVRTGLSVLLTAAMLPLFIPKLDAPVLPTGDYFILLVKEAIIGLTLAMIVLMLFEAVATIGALIDLARGATIANVYDPLTQNQQSILATFFTQATIVLFMSVGGLRFLIKALGESFVLIRPRDLLPAQLLSSAGAGDAVTLVADLFLLSFKIAAPTVAVLLLVDFALAVINRVSPQIQVYFLGLTTKGVIGLMVVFAGLGLTFEILVEQFGATLDGIRNWVATAVK